MIFQSEKSNLHHAVKNIDALIEELQVLRENPPKILAECTAVAEASQIETDLPRKRRPRKVRTRKMNTVDTA